MTRSLETPMSADTDIAERRRAVLLQNDFIGGNAEIVTRILACAQPRTFLKGHHLIQKGAADDCVYFITSGSADVRIHGRHIDTRSAPNTVGEMAAKRAGKPRTADVIVSSNALDALVVSGSEFRGLMRDFPYFQAKLDDWIDELSRTKISQLADKQVGWFSWPVLSGIAASVIAAVAALTMWLADFIGWQCVAGGLAFGTFTYIGLLLANPAHRYRNMSRAASLALFGLILYGGISFSVTVDGEKSTVPFFINFDAGLQVNLGFFAVSCAALLAIAWLGAHFDAKISQSDGTH